MGSKSRRWTVAAVVLALGAGAGFWLLRGASLPGAPLGEARAKAGEDKPTPPLEFSAAEVTRPRREALPLRIEFSGALSAPGTAVLRAKAAGTLAALDVAEGARVLARQVLGRIELSDLASRIADRSAQVDAARAALLEAERVHAANRQLAEQEFIAPTALQSSQARLDAARAQLDSARAQLATTRVALTEATLVAPIAGIVAKRHVLPGEKLSPEQQVLTIVDLSRLELAAMVGTHEVGRLAPGMAVRVAVEGVAEPVEGVLDRIAPAAEAGTRSIGVTVRVPNPGERLRAGQFALASVELPDATPRLTVPAAAVSRQAGQDFVWVVQAGSLLRRAITLGASDRSGQRVEVLQGLDEAAVLLAERFDNLREGAAVRIASASAAAVPRAAAASR